MAVKWEILVGGLTGLGVVVTLIGKLVAAADERHKAKFMEWISNGAGEVIQNKVKMGVLEALSEHQIQCPIRDRVSAIEDRLTTIERTE